MNEKQIERTCCKMAEAQGWIAIKLVSPNRRGIPDRMFIGFNGRIEFVEFKGPNGRLRPDQERMVRSLERHGQSCTVIDSVEDFVYLMGFQDANTR